MKALRLALVLTGCALLSSCFQIQAVHVLHYYGENDTGGYRIGFKSAMYSMLTQNGKLNEILQSLRRWSRPSVRNEGDDVYVEDTTGQASMENFYDTHTCRRVSLDFSECHFSFTVPPDIGQLVGWSVDWEVVLQPDMTVLSSNHQRIRQVDGLEHLIWFFDGNRDSNASVDFVVRVPNRY
jgi:hypothetical protein